jgi:hypothetical protein
LSIPITRQHRQISDLSAGSGGDECLNRIDAGY